MQADFWNDKRPAGVPSHIDLTVYKSVLEVFERSCKRFADRPAFTNLGVTLTYADLDRQSAAFAGYLQQHTDLVPGDRIAVQMPNVLQYPIAVFGAMRAGLIVVNTNPLYTAREMRHQFKDSGARALVYLNMFGKLVQEVLPDTGIEVLIEAKMGDLLPLAKGWLVNTVVARVKKMVPAYHLPQAVPFRQVMRQGRGHALKPVQVTLDDVAVLQYTGGTTGLPKGAMLTHANLTSACAQYFESTKGDPPILDEGKERFLVVLPLFHIFALSAAMLLGVRLGAALVLHTRFDVDAVMNELAASRISVFPGVPTMYTAILSHPKAREMDLRSLKFCGSGGAPLPVEVEQRFFELTGCHLNEGWGMTETSPVGTFTPARGLRKAGSCGMPLPRVRIKLVSLDDPAKDVATFGEPGELCIQGPNVMKGYWNNPKATAESMTPDGYFRSGDVARMDADGYLYIVDRTKDMLLCGGYNVYPRVLEEAVYEHPAVAEVCVIGIPDDYRGQSPKAFVKLKEGAPELTLDALKSFLKDRLGKHEMIGALEIRAELPKTAVGKLSKKDLVDEEARKRA